MKGLRLILLVLLLIDGGIIYGQSSAHKYWSLTPLEWDDFLGIPNPADSIPANFEYRIGVRYQKNKTPELTVIKSDVYAYMLKRDSWVYDSVKTDQFLDFHQVIFDMLEVCRRKTQKIYYTVDDPYTADSLFNYYTDLYEEERFNFYKRYFSVQEPKKLIQEYKEKVAIELANSDSSKIPDYEMSSFGYGYNLQAGYFHMNNTLSEKFTNSLAFQAGFLFEYKPLQLGLSASYGWNKVKSSFTETRTWTKDLRTGIMAIDVSAGLKLKLNKLTFIPFAGIQYYQLSPTSDLRAKNGYTIGGLCPTLGVATDYTLKRNLKLIPGSLFYNRTYSEFNLRFKLSVSNMDFGNAYKSQTILVGVGISSVSQVIKVL